MTVATSKKLADWCPNCRRLTYLKDDGLTFVNHYDRGGRRCRLSNKITSAGGTPQWLAILAEANAEGQFPPLWTRQQAATHLGLSLEGAWLAIRKAGIQPARTTGRGARHLYDPLDIEELKQWRAKYNKFGPPRKYANAAERALAGRAQRFAARELIDGRLVAVKASQHGSATTYSNHGCRCQPCTDANIRRMQEYKRTRQSQSPG